MIRFLLTLTLTGYQAYSTTVTVPGGGVTVLAPISLNPSHDEPPGDRAATFRATLEELKDAETKPDIRIYRVRYIDVYTAQDIIAADPLFVNKTNADYHLSGGSPSTVLPHTSQTW